MSGASGLVYQLLRSRYLGLLLGSSTVAIVVVLAAFIGGLAIGSYVHAGVADRGDVRVLRFRLDLKLVACSATKSAFVARGGCDGASSLARRLLALPGVPSADRRDDLANLAKAPLWSGRPAEAAATYEVLLKDEGAAPRQRAGWLAGQAAALMAAGDAERA